MRVWSIYKITNLVNGKVYIGQTCRRVDRRWYEHWYYAEREQSGCKYVARAIRKHGKNNFSCEVIGQACNKVDADSVERWFIEVLWSCKPAFGYNLTLGGEGTPQEFCKSGQHRKVEVGCLPNGACAPCTREYKAAWHQQKMARPGAREQQAQQSREYYQRCKETDPEGWKQKNNERNRQKRSDPTVRAAESAAGLKRWHARKRTSEEKAAKAEYDRKRRNDPILGPLIRAKKAEAARKKSAA